MKKNIYINDKYKIIKKRRENIKSIEKDTSLHKREEN